MIFKNAFKYVLRKRKKTFVIFIILSIVSSLLYASLNIFNENKKIEENFYKISNSSISLSKKDKSFINFKDIKNLENIQKIKESIFTFNTLSKLKGVNVVDENKIKRDDIDENLKNIVNVIAENDVSKNRLFKSKVLNIVKGRMLLKDDRGKILVHEKFLKKNNLNLNDKIKLQFIHDKKIKYENFEIVGVFDGKVHENFTGLSSDLTENHIFLDYESSMKHLNLKDNEKIFNKLTLFTDSKENLEFLEKNIKNTFSNNFLIEKNDKGFNDIINSVKEIKNILNIIIFSVIVVSIIVLCLILMLNIRERIYEIAILLSIGISKLKIMLQFIFELFLISIFSNLICFKFYTFLTQKITKYLVSTENLQNNFKNTFSFSIFLKSYVILLSVIIICIVLTLGTILIKKPKKILSKIS